MIEEYLNQRLDSLNSEKNALKDQMIEIRSSLNENKRMLDDYMQSSTRPFEPFSPRKNEKEDAKLAEMHENISSLNERFKNLSAQLNSIESEINVINQCLDDLHGLSNSDHKTL